MNRKQTILVGDSNMPLWIMTTTRQDSKPIRRCLGQVGDGEVEGESSTMRDFFLRWWKDSKIDYSDSCTYLNILKTSDFHILYEKL